MSKKMVLDPKKMADDLIGMGLPESMRAQIEHLVELHPTIDKEMQWDNGSTDDPAESGKALEYESLAHGVACVMAEDVDPAASFNAGVLIGLAAAAGAPDGWAKRIGDVLIEKQDATRQQIIREAAGRIRAGHSVSKASFNATLDAVEGKDVGPTH